jgi:hypothetical protein
MSNWPKIELDAQRAAEWLAEESDNSGDETNAEDAGAYADEHAVWPIAQGGDGFLAVVDNLASAASNAGLFGSGVAVTAYITADTSLNADGALVVVQLGRHDETAGTWDRIRLVSCHQDHRDLTDDEDADGEAGALAILRALVATANEVMAEAHGWHRATVVANLEQVTVESLVTP